MYLRKQLSLSIGVLLFILALGVMAVTLLSTNNALSKEIHLHTQGLQQELVGRQIEFGQALGQVSARTLTNPLYFQEAGRIRELVKGLNTHPDIRFMLVYDAEQRLLYSPDNSDIGGMAADVFAQKLQVLAEDLENRPMALAGELMLNDAIAFASPNALSQQQHFLFANHLLVQRPVVFDGANIGGVIIGLTTEFIAENHAQLRQNANAALQRGKQTALLRALLMTLVFILLALWFVGWQARRISAPLQRLAKAMPRLEKTYKKVDEDRHRDDELGVVVRAYQQMLATLDETELTRDRYRQLAEHDPLTALPNRRYFSAHAESMLERAAQQGFTVVIVALDLDNFKPINDLHGHQVGDELLKLLAERLRACIQDNVQLSTQSRELSLPGRMGGDEFTLVLVDIDLAQADELFSTLVQQLCQHYEIGNETFSPGVSVGVAFYPSDGQVLSDLLHRADQALYLAKSTGKRRYCTYQDLVNKQVKL